MAKKKVQKRYPATMYGGKVVPGRTYWTTKETNPIKRFKNAMRWCFGR